MFSSYGDSELVKNRTREAISKINAQDIRQDIASAGYMKSDGSINSPEGNFDGIKNIPKEIGALSSVKDGTQTFYAFLVQRITELKKKKEDDPLFDDHSYIFHQLAYPIDKVVALAAGGGNIHLLRSLLFKYQTSNDSSQFSIKNKIPVDSIANPGSSRAKNVFYKQGFYDQGGAYTKLLKRLINKLVAKEAADRVKDLGSGSIQQPDPFYYKQARKVLNGGNASYQGPPPEGSDDFSLTNLAGYQNIQYIGAGMGVLAFTLIGGTILAKFRN